MVPKMTIIVSVDLVHFVRKSRKLCYIQILSVRPRRKKNEDTQKERKKTICHYRKGMKISKYVGKKGYYSALCDATIIYIQRFKFLITKNHRHSV